MKFNCIDQIGHTHIFTIHPHSTDFATVDGKIIAHGTEEQIVALCREYAIKRGWMIGEELLNY